MSWRPCVIALAGLSGCVRPNPIFGADGGGETEGSTSGPSTAETSASSQSSTRGDTTFGSEGNDSSVDEGSSSGAMSTPECGNGVTEGDEQCDLGDDNADYGLCLSDCRDNVCGDGHKAPNQPCDDMNRDPNDGCDMCKLVTCGNNMIDEGEDCDDGPLGSYTCTPLCTTPACGDGILTPPEECEDDDQVAEDECHDCIASTCGDGIVWTDVEECDDHGTEDNDGCSAACIIEFCGDGIQQTSEECDNPRVALSCVDVDMMSQLLTCSGDACQWTFESGECCMPADQPCLEQIPCCPGLNCGDGGICSAG
jgi:cysteine-rich repeat protein